MSNKKRKTPPEFIEGRRAYPEQIILLRKEWPKAFPEDTKKVRPLAMDAMRLIAEKMGWSLMYTRGILQSWKMRAAYCKAVLRHEKRIKLNGKESVELVDEAARLMAQKQLAFIQQRNEAKGKQTTMVSSSSECSATA